MNEEPHTCHTYKAVEGNKQKAPSVKALSTFIMRETLRQRAAYERGVRCVQGVRRRDGSRHDPCISYSLAVCAQVRKRCVYLGQLASTLAAQHAARADDAFDGVAVDANALGWALAAVTSRAFRVFGPDKPAALLPLIDFANHSFQPNATVTPRLGLGLGLGLRAGLHGQG